MLQLNPVLIFQQTSSSPALAVVFTVVSAVPSPCSPWAQSEWRCVRNRCRFIGKQLPVSSKRATEWETLPPTPQTPAASAGAAAVAAPGNNTPLLPTHAGLEIAEMWFQAQGGTEGPLTLFAVTYTFIHNLYLLSLLTLQSLRYFSLKNYNYIFFLFCIIFLRKCKPCF